MGWAANRLERNEHAQQHKQAYQVLPGGRLRPQAIVLEIKRTNKSYLSHAAAVAGQSQGLGGAVGVLRAALLREVDEPPQVELEEPSGQHGRLHLVAVRVQEAQLVVGM